MIKNPLEIFLELIIGLLDNLISTLIFIAQKLYELYSSLSYFGFAISLTITFLIVFFLRKQITSSIFSILIFLGLLFLILLIVSILSSFL